MNERHRQSIEMLNQALSEELSAIHQYMYFHFRLDDLGYTPLANFLRTTAIAEMQHAERIAERILFLGGEVEMELARPVEKITDAVAMLEKARELEEMAISLYNQLARRCAEVEDSGTKKLFEELVAEEELHLDDFDKQAGFVKRFGERYLALQSFGSEGSE